MTADLNSLFDPENVAIIGASRNGKKVGHSIMYNFVEGKFSGDIYPVNPNADKVMNRECYDSVLDIESDIDLGVVTVPPKVATQTIKQSVKKGVKNLIVITSGFGELGEEGSKRKEEIKNYIEQGDTRLLGPNCIGVWDAYSGVDTLFVPSYKLSRPLKGNIAILTQSGAFGTSVLDLLAEMKVGVSRFISYGNQLDLKELEIINWLKQDEKTDAITIYTEGISDGRKFIHDIKQVTEDKPIVILKGGKRASGKSAVSSHTGSLAGSYQVYQGAFRQTGSLEAKSIEGLFDYSRALAYNPPLEGNKIGVITNGGGFGVLTSDSLEKYNLTVPDFSPETKQKLREILPKYGNVGNPLDLLGDSDSTRYEEALQVLKKEKNLDGLIVIPLLQFVPMESDVVDVILNFKNKFNKPLFVCMAGGDYSKLHIKNFERNGVPAYPDPERAAKAMKSLHDYNRWLKKDQCWNCNPNR